MVFNTEIRIIIVDELSTMRRIIKNILNDLGFNHVYEADTPSVAITVLNCNDFDLIITEWNLPGIGGVKFLKYIRENVNLKHLPILIVSADSSREHVIEAVELGVSGYMIKPFTAETLKKQLVKVLSI